MPGRIKIAIVDDEHLIRQGIRLILEKEKNFDVVFEGDDGQALLGYLCSGARLPDIVLLDIRMEGLNGIETTRHIAERFPEVRVIILSSLKSEQIVRQMIYYGVSAYLVKNSHPLDMITAINQVYENGIHFDPDMMKIIVNMKNLRSAKPGRQFCELSEREVEILNLICGQFNTKEIADKLYLSERTVEGHRKRMLEKTNSRNVVGLIVWGIKNQILLLE